MGRRVQSAHALCVRVGTLPFHFGTSKPPFPFLVSALPRETKTDSECPPSRPPVQTQIKTDAPPRDVAERRQRGEVRKASEEWQESRGKRGRRHGEAPQGGRGTRQALAGEDGGRGTGSRGDPGRVSDGTSGTSSHKHRSVCLLLFQRHVSVGANGGVVEH